MRSKLAMVAAGAMVAVAVLGACSKNTGTSNKTATVTKNVGGISTDPKDSEGPAAAVSGARKGGALHILQEADYEHLDPGRTYVVQAMAIEQEFARTLTMFRQDSNGKLVLVGDLATGPGTDVNGDCKEWKYTLKDGLKYEDGSAITAKDVAYAVSREFSLQIAEGPHYLQQWLANDANYNKKYKGPYNGGAAIAPGLSTPNDKTLIFKFAQPHCDLPFAVQLPSSAPVPQSKDTGASYDNHPFSSGPYKIQSYNKGSKLTLERNKYWDPNTDPIRHDYPDTIDVTFGATDVTQTQRLIADNGSDQNAVQEANVPQSLIEQVTGNSDLTSREVKGQTPFVYYLAVNTQHIKDLKVRQALAYAIDRKAVVQALGGSALATEGTTLESPTVIGWKNYDAYPYNPSKAKSLLGGKEVSIVYGYRNAQPYQRLAPVFQNMLQKAGFKVTLRAIDADSYFTELGRKNNGYDLYLTDWAADWPGGSAVMPVLTDGRTIQPNGNNVVSYYNNDSYNAKLDAAAKLPTNKSASTWADLDKEYATKYATVMPVYYLNGLSLVGSKVGGVFLSTSLGTPVFTNAYLKQ